MVEVRKSTHFRSEMRKAAVIVIERKYGRLQTFGKIAGEKALPRSRWPGDTNEIGRPGHAVPV